MSDKMLLNCPKCKNKIEVKLLACKEGTEIFCPQCNNLIKLHFNGISPQNILDGIKKALKKSWKTYHENGPEVLEWLYLKE